jgi:hypothetical protein
MELLVILLVVYFVPTVIALARGHHQSAAIFLTNLFLGWTVLGWLAALIWSATAKRQPQNIVVINDQPYAATTTTKPRGQVIEEQVVAMMSKGLRAMRGQEERQ